MEVFKIAVTYELFGVIEVYAESIREAVNKVNENPDEYPLPEDSDYVDGSFVANYDDSIAINQLI